MLKSHLQRIILYFKFGPGEAKALFLCFDNSDQTLGPIELAKS